MLEVIVYESFEEKKAVEVEVLSDEQTLINMLNIMGLNAEISSQNPTVTTENDQEWIELNFCEDDRREILLETKRL